MRARPRWARRRSQRQPERARPGSDRDAVVPVGDADPTVGDTPDDLPQGDGDHDKAEPGAAQRQYGKDRGGGDGHHQRAEDAEEVTGTAIDKDRPGIGGDAEESRMAERDEARIADQQVEPQREDGIEQDLGGDVHVIVVGDPER